VVAQQRRKIAEGREAEIYEYDGDTVLKLFHDDRPPAWIEHESAAMNAVRAAGGPAPEARGFVREQDRPGLLIERIDGPDMLTLLAKKPWTLWKCARLLGEAHAAMHDVIAPASLPAQKDRFRSHIEAAAAPASEHARLAQFVLRALDELPAGDRVCHGDYHPANVLVTDDGPRVIDWPAAMRGDPHGDVARTLLIFDIASVPPGSPTLIRSMQKFARGILRSRYLGAYRRLRPLDDELLVRWRIPVAAERLHDGIADEQEKLLAILYAALNRSS
jgi:Ser/Thr protein kinase RdoA (MazF antagonist)